MLASYKCTVSTHQHPPHSLILLLRDNILLELDCVLVQSHIDQKRNSSKI